jgi:hypothetical protein
MPSIGEKKIKIIIKGLGCSSVVQLLPNMFNAGSIPSTAKQNKTKKAICLPLSNF